jgi:hypothetical protein
MRFCAWSAEPRATGSRDPGATNPRADGGCATAACVARRHKIPSGTRFPVDLLPAGTVLHRIRQTALSPVFFGPGPGTLPTYRSDSARSRFGVLYVSLSRAGALAETLFRNPQRLMVAISDIADRAATELACRRELRVVKLYGSGLPAVGHRQRGLHWPLWALRIVVRRSLGSPGSNLMGSRTSPGTTRTKSASRSSSALT